MGDGVLADDRGNSRIGTASRRQDREGMSALAKLIVLAALLVTTTVCRPALAEVAGAVVALRVWAYGTPPDSARRDLFMKDDVYARELLETAPQGALHVRLLDDSMLRLGSGTSVVLDEFVYTPDASTSTLLASISKGVCRFISGRATTHRLEVSTPAATIAARGTEFSLWIKPDGSTTVWVQRGQVEVAPRDGSPHVLVNAGEIVLAPFAGGGVQLNAPRPSPDPGIADTPRVLFPRRKGIR